MCGICGIIRADNKVDEASIHKMMKVMKHRGPDDEDLLVEDKLGLGHVRLSIIDLSPKGRQPMANDDKTMWIIYNGEIYNYIELKKELEQSGYKFRSKSDTEVLLKAYEHWGKDCLSKLNGMFAFVIYDKKHKTLFGARDRFGIKPLYYYSDTDKFIFASEIKPILSTGIKPVPNYDIIHDFIRYKLMSHTENTFFEKIKKVLPGHYVEVDLETRDIKLTKWWELEINIKDIDMDAAVAKYKKLFRDSVKLRLRSDVPVGSCLSGGLDSSSVVCTMHKFLGDEGDLNTFSSVYSIDFFGNEKKYIRELVKQLGITGFEIEPSSDELMKDLDKLVYYQEEPFYGLSPFAQWEVMKLTHQRGLKVLLDGQGGDETLAGYDGYIGFYYATLLKRFKIGLLRKELGAYKKLHGRKYPFKDVLYPLVPGFMKKRAREKQAYYVNKQFFQKYKGSDLYLYLMSSRPLNVILKESMRYQLMELLRFEDKSSMAFSIETRLPFLDYRLVNYVFTLPDDLKIRGGQSKYVFRQALKDLLPEIIYNRKDKVGFATPEEIWLKDEKIWKFVERILTSERAFSRKIYDQDGIKQLLKSFKSGNAEAFRHIWSLVILELWFKIFFDDGYEIVGEVESKRVRGEEGKSLGDK